MAQMSSGPDQGKVVVLLSLGLGILVAGLLAGLLFFRGAGGGEGGEGFPMILAAVIVFVGILIVAVKLQSR